MFTYFKLKNTLSQQLYLILPFSFFQRSLTVPELWGVQMDVFMNA